MILWILFMVTNLHAENTFPVEDLEKQGVVQSLKANLDDKFSVSGGTVAGSVYVSTSIYAGGSLVPTSDSSNTFTQANTFNGSVITNSSVTINGGLFGNVSGSSSTLTSGSNQSIAATSSPGTAVDNSTVTWNVYSNRSHVEVCATITCLSGIGTSVNYEIWLDGVAMCGGSNGCFVELSNNSSTFCVPSRTASQGSHTAYLRAWSPGSGGITISKSNPPLYVNAKEVRE